MPKPKITYQTELQYDYLKSSPLMIDVSRYQSLIDPETFEVLKYMDFSKSVDQGVKAVVMRCTIGDYGKDVCFDRYWEDTARNQLKRIPYHVIAPATRSGRTISAEAQMDKFFSEMGVREPDVFLDTRTGKYIKPVVLDCELNRGQTPVNISSLIKICCNIVVSAGYTPMIYTSKGWWDHWVIYQPYWKEYLLFVANYTGADNPVVPEDWEDLVNPWIIWQFTSTGTEELDGKDYGAYSFGIDLDRVFDPAFLNLDNLPIPPTNGDEPMDITQIIADYEALEAASIPSKVVQVINYYFEQPDNGGGTPVEPPPDPPTDPDPEPTTLMATITDDKALAHFIYAKNAVEKPMLKIYPSESKEDVDKRVKFTQGASTKVFADKLDKDDVDGSQGYWQLVSFFGEDDEKLYLQESKVSVA